MLVFANPRMEELALGPFEYLRSPGFLADMRADDAARADRVRGWST